MSALRLTPGQRAALAARGYSPADVGRITNRVAPGQVDPANIPIPTDPAELEAMLGDSARMQEVFKNQGAFSQFIQNYATNVLQTQQTIGQQVREQVTNTLTEWARENPDLNRPNLTAESVLTGDRAWKNAARRPGGLHNPRAMGAAIDHEFENSGDYFRTIWHLTDKTAAVQDKRSRIRNAFSSTVPSEGGFLIPETLRSELLRVSLESSIVRSRARIVPMESLTVPFPAIDSTSNVSSVYGGIIGYWTEEGAALTASQATFGRILLAAKKLTAYTEVPNELLSDSIGSFMAFIDTMFPEALAFYEDDAFLNGNGVGMPLGILAAENVAAIEVAKETNQPADTIVWENIVKMYARMLPGSLGRAVWLVSPDTFPELATMALNVGTGGSAIWLNNGVEGPPMSILGRPVIVTEKAPQLGLSGDINFVDFGFYLVGDRQVMSAQSSEHYKFGNDSTAYRIIERVDGRPWLQSAITPKNNGNSLSPFVKLAERA